MADFRQDQMLMWTMFQNLRHDAATYKPTDIEPTNYAQELLTGLLNNEIFRDTIKSVASSLQRNDIAAEVDATPITPGARDGMANDLVAAAVAGDKDMVADLSKTPATTINSLDELNQFWNADALIRTSDPDLHTHIVADPRYIQAFDAYVAANEISGEAITKLRADIVAKHETAVQTLDTMEYDGIQMALYASSQSFYELSAKGDYATIGYNETAPSTIFTGLKIEEPLTQPELQRVTAPLPSDVIQAEKDKAAEAAPAIVEAEQPVVKPDTIIPPNVVSGGTLLRPFLDAAIADGGVTSFKGQYLWATMAATGAELNPLQEADVAIQNFKETGVVKGPEPEIKVEPEPVAEPEKIDPSTLTKEQIVAGLNDLQAHEGTITLDTYKQGFVLLNPAYEKFFDAVDNSGGALVNPLRDQLEKALNNDPAVLKAMIDISDDPAKIEALTASIATEGGSTNLVLALAKANGEAPLSIDPHKATPLEGPDIADATVLITEPEPEIKVEPEAGPAIVTIQPPFLAASAAELDPTKIDPALTAEAEPEPEPEPEPTKYTVQRGDNLWNIAKDTYGLSSYKDIMRAVDHIAVANGLEKGTDANWISTGAEITMPTPDTIAGPVKPLDWQALATDPKLGASARVATMALGG